MTEQGNENDMNTATDTDKSTTDEKAPQEGQNAAVEPSEGKEAMRYRRQLRESQESNAALAGRIEQMQRREVERLAEGRLAVPSDLWAVGGLELADMLDDAGDVDQAAVTAAIGDLVGARPGLEPRSTAPDYTGGTREPISIGGATWSDVLNPRNQRRP